MAARSQSGFPSAIGRVLEEAATLLGDLETSPVDARAAARLLDAAGTTGRSAIAALSVERRRFAEGASILFKASPTAPRALTPRERGWLSIALDTCASAEGFRERLLAAVIAAVLVERAVRAALDPRPIGGSEEHG